MMKKSSYKQNICNVPGCDKQEYEHHMCQRHYEFYSANPLIAQFIAQEKALEDDSAGWKLKLKVVLQSIVHHALNLPMPLISHFPLEHVFLGELYSLRNNKTIDRKRVEQVIADFDIPENENIADMRRVLNIRDIETSELGPKENYLLGREDLPSKWPFLLSIVGFILLFCLIELMAKHDFQIRGAELLQIKVVYWKFIPFGYALGFFIFLGTLIPSQYNFFVERCYSMTLYKRVEENADVVNQIKFVKERKARSGSYFATLLGSSLGTTALIFWTLLSHGTHITWWSLLFCTAVSLTVVPLVFSFSEMALFYPVVDSMKRKRVAIDLYNADHRGGLKRFHRFLFLTFLYNEGVAVILIVLYRLLPISNWWIILLVLLILPRFKHAGWAMISWLRSVKDFYKEKSSEKEKLTVLEGSLENMNKVEMLNKIHPIGIISLLLNLIEAILIPYLVNQLPKICDIIGSIGK